MSVIRTTVSFLQTWDCPAFVSKFGFQLFCTVAFLFSFLQTFIRLRPLPSYSFVYRKKIVTFVMISICFLTFRSVLFRGHMGLAYDDNNKNGPTVVSKVYCDWVMWWRHAIVATVRVDGDVVDAFIFKLQLWHEVFDRLRHRCGKRKHTTFTMRRQGNWQTHQTRRVLHVNLCI